MADPPKRVRKAVFPAAGLGTRFLPATKAQPKEMLPNTPPYDCTHHPAMSLPCGLYDGLPVGMMLVAKAFSEGSIYRAAAAFERGVDWKSLHA